ncbi:hypothetical protein BKD26_35695 [Streptomyces sp. CB03238]|nr:hypothetical protein BKD26_35695 [Streptomyces sp. CB03238]
MPPCRGRDDGHGRHPEAERRRGVLRVHPRPDARHHPGHHACRRAGPAPFRPGGPGRPPVGARPAGPVAAHRGAARRAVVPAGTRAGPLADTARGDHHAGLGGRGAEA